MNDSIILFDIDGTLTEPRCKIEEKMIKFLNCLKRKFKIGCVGGSNFEKAKEQVGDNILEIFDYSFFENGLNAYKNDILIEKQNLFNYIGNEKINKFINFVLKYISELNIPVKTGTFIEYSIGGQISFDVFPVGWDKTFCLKFLNDFNSIYFIGDKTDIGGNDYEIYESERTISFKTKGVDDTIRILKIELFK